MRSGYYKLINVIEVRKGELKKWNPLTEEIEISLIDDFEEREKAPIIGYVAMFEYLNGFRKVLYWSRDKMINHADRYSPAFSKEATKGKFPKVSFEDYCNGNYPKDDAWKYSSFWYKDFDGMAYKTMLRQLISKWGIMSIELQTAFENDMVEDVIAEDTSYVETPPIIAPVTSIGESYDVVEEASEEQVSLGDIG